MKVKIWKWRCPNGHKQRVSALAVRLAYYPEHLAVCVCGGRGQLPRNALKETR